MKTSAILLALLLAVSSAPQAAPSASPVPPRVPNPAFGKAPAPGAAVSVSDTVYGVMRMHRTLRGMQENQKVLEHELDRAYSGHGPKVDVQVSGGWGSYSDSSTRRSGLDAGFDPQIKMSAQLVQPIWDGFATRSRVRSAQATLDSMKHRVFDNATSLSLDGIIAHINLLRSRTLVALAQENVDIHERILGMAEDRTSMGADTAADASQANSRYQRALSYLSEQKDSLRVAEKTFYRLTGLSPDSNLQVVPMPPAVYGAPKDILHDSVRFNPKLQAYMQDIKIKVGDKELAESAYYPKFNIEAGPSYTDRGGDDNYDRWVYQLDAMVTMRWNIFNSGADVAEVKAANARIRQARQVYYDYIDELCLDVDSTWSNYIAAQEQYQHYAKAIEYNKRTLNAYNDQFQLGRRTLLDVLDSENELYNSSVQAETARGNILVGAYRLMALTGTMLPKMGIKTDGLKAKPPVDKRDDREVFKAGWFD